MEVPFSLGYMCLSIFLSLSAFPVDPSHSLAAAHMPAPASADTSLWVVTHWPPAASPFPTLALAGLSCSQGGYGHKATGHRITSPKQLWPTQAQTAPGALLSRTTQTYALLLATAKVIFTGLHRSYLCWIWEKCWHWCCHFQCVFAKEIVLSSSLSVRTWVPVRNQN